MVGPLSLLHAVPAFLSRLPVLLAVAIVRFAVLLKGRR